MRKNLLYYIRIAPSCQPIISATISAARGGADDAYAPSPYSRTFVFLGSVIAIAILQGEIWLIWESSEMFWHVTFIFVGPIQR